MSSEFSQSDLLKYSLGKPEPFEIFCNSFRSFSKDLREIPSRIPLRIPTILTLVISPSERKLHLRIILELLIRFKQKFMLKSIRILSWNTLKVNFQEFLEGFLQDLLNFFFTFSLILTQISPSIASEETLSGISSWFLKKPSRFL